MGNYPQINGPSVPIGLNSKASNLTHGVTVLVYSDKKYHSESGTILVYTERKYGPSEAQSFSIDSTNTIAAAVTSLTQRVNPTNLTPYYIGDLVGVVYGSGGYDGLAISLALVEKASSLSGPWTTLTPIVSDPSYVFPATATIAGSPFNIPIEPEDWSSGTLYIRVTITPLAQPDIEAVGGCYWDGASIVPSTPTLITVPTGSTSGNYTVSWSEVVGASGYQLQEGVEQPDTSIVWGSMVYTGTNSTYDTTGQTPDYTYWYRVRATNPANNSPYLVSSNGCFVQQPFLYISPNLGWANISRMLNPAYNSLAIAIELGTLATTDLPYLGYLGPEYPVLPASPSNVLLPASAVNLLKGNEVRYYFTVGSDRPSTFILRKSTKPVEQVEG